MKILVVTNMYPYEGSEHYGVFVREHVEALRAAGADVDVAFSNPREGRARYVLDVPGLTRRLRRQSYDVLHAQHTYSVFQTVLARAAARSQAPLVVTTHEGEAHAAADDRDAASDLLNRLVYSRQLKRRALELSDEVVAVESRLARLTGFKGPYTVIPPAVNVRAFRPFPRDDARRALGLPTGERVALFPADPTGSHKGVDLFHASTLHTGIGFRTIYGGSISRDQMPLHMNAVDVVVQTSRFEASPMVVKEALACDTPVVSTDVGDVAELFGDLPGCFVAPADPRAVADAVARALRFEGGTGGPERIRELGLTPRAVADRYLEVYERARRLRHWGQSNRRSRERRA